MKIIFVKIFDGLCINNIKIIQYSIVFDAGSSGTRMFVYQWDAGYDVNKKNPLTIKQINDCTTDGKLFFLIKRL